jgi:hypothetical protein
MKVGREIGITYYPSHILYLLATTYLPINQTLFISFLHMKLILLWTLIILLKFKNTCVYIYAITKFVTMRNGRFVVEG